MQISDAEQLRRFESRRDNPLKSYKLTEEDWRNRAKRKYYEEAVEDMFEETSIPEAPWVVIPAENMRYARVDVLNTAIRAIELGMNLHGIEPLTPLT